MVIKSENIRLKSAGLDDAELEQISKDSDDWEYMSETRMYPEKTPTELKFRIELPDGKLIGELKLTRIRWFNRKCELSIILDKQFQNQGFGTTAMIAVINHIFFKMNFHRVEAEVIEFNEHSIKLIEKLGFSKEGILREAKFSQNKYYNIFRYGLLKSEWMQMIK